MKVRLSTPIGRALEGSPRALAAGGVALAAVALDVLALRSDAPFGWQRWIPAIVALAILDRLARDDRGSLGLVLRPLPSAAYWVKATLVIGALVGALVALALLGTWLASAQRPDDLIGTGIGPEEARRLFFRMTVAAPLLEELVWRAVVCVPAAALFGPWPAVALSGAGFALLHVAYGNPAPDNLVAGFFLAWAYLRSGTIAMPIALHALGNLCVLGARLAWGAWGG